MPDTSDLPEWRKSSYCGSSACVEVLADGDLYAIRGSTKPDRVLVFDRAEWAAFVRGVRDGQFG